MDLLEPMAAQHPYLLCKDGAAEPKGRGGRPVVAGAQGKFHRSITRRHTLKNAWDGAEGS